MVPTAVPNRDRYGSYHSSTTAGRCAASSSDAPASTPPSAPSTSILITDTAGRSRARHSSSIVLTLTLMMRALAIVVLLNPSNNASFGCPTVKSSSPADDDNATPRTIQRSPNIAPRAVDCRYGSEFGDGSNDTTRQVAQARSTGIAINPMLAPTSKMVVPVRASLTSRSMTSGSKAP